MIFRILLFSVIFGLHVQAAELKKLASKDNRVYRKDDNTIFAFKKNYSGKSVCTEQAMINPEEVEIYEIAGNSNVLVLFCTSSLDGEENSITVFRKNKKPKTKRVTAPPSSYRIEDDTLKKIVTELIK